MKSKHTKGKWYAVQHGLKHTVRCKNETQGSLFVASCSQSDDEETKANAQLMANAPRLLEALNKIIECCDGTEYIYDVAEKAINEITQ